MGFADFRAVLRRKDTLWTLPVLDINGTSVPGRAGCGLGQQVLSKLWGMAFPLHGAHVDQDRISVSLSSVSAAVCIVFGGFGETNVVGMPCLWEEETSG